VATERALQPHLPPPQVLAGRCLTLNKGDIHDLEQLGEALTRLGYERVPTIEQEGTWSRRGDIIDLFPVSAELPVRLELFGEDLEKLREFDPASQRSLDAIERVRLTPTSHAPLIADALRERMPEGLEALLSDGSARTLEELASSLGLASPEPLFWTLRHLCHNSRGYRAEGDWGDPARLLFSTPGAEGSPGAAPQIVDGAAQDATSRRGGFKDSRRSLDQPRHAAPPSASRGHGSDP
jgi:hypothetical protein